MRPPPLLSLSILLYLHLPLATATYNWDITTHGLVSGWKWEKPWPHDDSDMMTFVEKCRSSATFKGIQYKFADLHKAPPAGMAPYADAVEDLSHGRVYPGSWDGVNVKGNERDILFVDYSEIPELARTFIEDALSTEDGRNRHYFRVLEKAKPKAGGHGGAVAEEKQQIDFNKDISGLDAKDKVWVTAPGELYPMLPLWVAKGSKCEDTLKDLSKYVAARAKHECVIAWPTDHSRALLDDGHKEISFRIEARWVKETEEGIAARIYWERHHAELMRQQRKYDREERARQRKKVDNERGEERDEL